MTEQLADVTELPTPIFEVARGNPTDEELGAAMVVLAAALRPAPPPRESDDRPLAGGWKSYWRTVRRPLVSGREAWRSSFRI